MFCIQKEVCLILKQNVMDYNITDHHRFEALLDDLGLSRRELAQELDIKYTSITNQLAPAKELPKWAKSMLLVQDRWKRKEKLPRADGGKDKYGA